MRPIRFKRAVRAASGIFPAVIAARRKLLEHLAARAARTALSGRARLSRDALRRSEKRSRRHREEPARRSEIAMVLDSDATSVPHVLSFAFRRIAEGSAIERVLVVVDDVTESLRRNRQMRIADAIKAKQFDMLSDIVGLRPEVVAGLVSAALRSCGAWTPRSERRRAGGARARLPRTRRGDIAACPHDQTLRVAGRDFVFRALRGNLRAEGRRGRAARSLGR